MPIEQDLHYPQPPTPDPHVPEMEQMETLWQVLPGEHQVALALKFMDTIMTSEYRPYFLLLMAQKWPLETEEP